MLNQVIEDRYEATEKIGESALFTVYKARDKSANRLVALKLLNVTFAREKEFATGLKQGVKAAIALSHPSIAATEDLRPYESTGYIVVEFVRGVNLKERIRRIAPFGLSAAIDFAIAIAEGLHHAHSMGQPHGDLRPQNIIITPEGTLKITDFGVQPAVAGSLNAREAILRHAAYYHAPEVSLAQRGTPAGDIYSLGAILYEMLTGSPLYAGDALEAIADQHAFAAIPSPRAVNPGVPRAVEGIILKCLQKKPADRYRTASDLLTDLKAVRDALRFGKSLSWSPIDTEKAAAAPVVATETSAEAPRSTPTEEAEPVAAVAASSEAVAMPTKARKERERVSIFLRAAIFAVTTVIIVCLVVTAGLWITNWAVPKAQAVPELAGKSIEEARQIAASMELHLIEHSEYSERPRNIIYKTDKALGTTIRPKQAINVWYSKGSIYVDVPKLTNMTREAAEKKLKDVGLTLGTVTNENSEQVAEGKVIRQADKRRVLHDTPIDVVLSSGPKVTYSPPEETNKEKTQNPDGTFATPADIEEQTKTHEFSRTIRIGKDEMGKRQVRVEYDDYIGTHVVIDEMHDEGDSVPLSFTYTGKTIKLRIFYNGHKQKEYSFDPQKSTGRME